MKIQWLGSQHVIRKVGHYTWDKSNRHTLEIPDGPFCADLLTANSEFKLAANEPLLQVMNANQVIELAIFGPDSLATLAAFNTKGINRLAELSGQSVSQIRAWVKQAQKLMEAKHGK